YQGVLLVGFRLRGQPREDGGTSWNWTNPLKVIAFFQLTCLGWLIFRCESLAQIVSFPRAILTHFRFTREDLHTSAVLGLLVCRVLLFDLLEAVGSEQLVLLERFPSRLRLALVAGTRLLRFAGVAALFVLLWALGSRGGKPFIYFQF